MIIGPCEEPDIVIDRVGRGEVDAYKYVICLVTVVVHGLLTHFVDGRVTITLYQLLWGTLQEDSSQRPFNNDKPEVLRCLIVSENV